MVKQIIVKDREKIEEMPEGIQREWNWKHPFRIRCLNLRLRWLQRWDIGDDNEVDWLWAWNVRFQGIYNCKKMLFLLISMLPPWECFVIYCLWGYWTKKFLNKGMLRVYGGCIVINVLLVNSLHYVGMKFTKTTSKVSVFLLQFVSFGTTFCSCKKPFEMFLVRNFNVNRKW